jgi:uncharacterized Rmd1/YagE family protein
MRSTTQSTPHEEDPWSDADKKGSADDDVATSLPKELFFFDYGVVTMWGLTTKEQEIVLEV